jgi:hypothetical protein
MKGSCTNTLFGTNGGGIKIDIKRTLVIQPAAGDEWAGPG